MGIGKHLINRINTNSLYQSIGIQLRSAGKGEARSVLRPAAAVCWPFENQPHGGILFTLMDTTMAWAIQSELASGFSCTTIDLDIRYILPARGEAFSCRARAIHRTNRLCFVSAVVTDPEDRTIASGQATFRIIKMDFI
jgi:uncharacterized protein (TIGR00369 family)